MPFGRPSSPGRWTGSGTGAPPAPMHGPHPCCRAATAWGGPGSRRPPWAAAPSSAAPRCRPPRRLWGRWPPRRRRRRRCSSASPWSPCGAVARARTRAWVSARTGEASSGLSRSARTRRCHLCRTAHCRGRQQQQCPGCRCMVCGAWTRARTIPRPALRRSLPPLPGSSSDFPGKVCRWGLICRPRAAHRATSRRRTTPRCSAASTALRRRCSPRGPRCWCPGRRSAPCCSTGACRFTTA
mmetsp:Transcript_85254/g.275147  ORF Transcript_85254/g.275147 Transcript_85254/m.275147 type:complete len:240 (+) Transcript_85254:225-944(+)